MMNPEISILVPVYNVEKYIEKCLISLFNNTYINKTEVIIINDCSTDNSFSIAKNLVNKYPNLNVKLLSNKTNLGIGKTREILFKEASGKYIIYIDSDDWIEDNFIEKLYCTAEEEKADLTGCGVYFEYENSNKSKIRNYEIPIDSFTLLKDIFTGKNGGYLWCKLYKRSFLLQNNIIPEPDINFWEDVLFNTRVCLSKPKTAYTNTPLYHYIIRQGSILHKKYNQNIIDNICLAVATIESLLNGNSELLSALIIGKFNLRNNLLFRCDKKVLVNNIYVFPETFHLYNDKTISFSKIKKVIIKISLKNKKIGILLILLYRKLTYLKNFLHF